MIGLLLRDGNAARIAGRYTTAEERFAAARARLRDASLVSSLDAARLYSYEASLRVDQWRPREAWSLLMRAEMIAEAHDDKALLARTLYQLGIAADDLGEPDAAVRRLLGAKRLYREAGERAMDVAVLSSLAVVLAGAGEVDRALRYHLMGEASANRYLPPRALRSYRWARGVITLRAGCHAAALALFEEVLAAAEDVPQAANLLVDLAEAQAGVGDYRAVEETAGRLATLFGSLGVSPGVMAAAQLLQQAANCRLVVILECVAAVRSARRG